MKPVKGPMISEKEGMPQYATQGSQQLDQKVNETCGRSSDPGKEGMPQYVIVNKLGHSMSQNYCALKYAHPSSNGNAQPQIGNAK